MLPYTTFNDIIKNLKKSLQDLTGLDPNRVLSTTAVRGADLSKIINESQVNSFNLSDSFIVFELKESNDKDYYIIDENDNERSIISRYHMDIKLYGNACHIVSQQILARFKDATLLQDLYEKGIHYTGITPVESVNEFINNTLWKRCDMTIHLQARMKVDKIKPDEYFPENTDYDFFKEISIKRVN